MLPSARFLSLFAVVSVLSSMTAAESIIDSHSLVARADGLPASIPSQCQSPCQVVADIQKCEDVTCSCNDKVSDSLAGCYDCLATAAKNETYTKTAQASFDGIANTCKAAGSPIKAQTIKANDAVRASVGLAVIGAVTGLLLNIV